MENRGASQAAWRKSTYSGGATNCVEVADNVTAAVAVRDSKNPEGSALTFTPGAWDAFTGAVKNGEHATQNPQDHPQNHPQDLAFPAFPW